MDIQPKDIAEYVRQVVDKKQPPATRKNIAAELGVEPSYITKLIRSAGEKGRLVQWYKILDLCGFDLQITSKKGYDHSDIPVEATTSVQEDQPTYQTQIDTDLHKEIITAVENFLASEGLALPPDKKAEVITLLYELYSDTGKTIEGETVRRYLKLVA